MGRVGSAVLSVCVLFFLFLFFLPRIGFPPIGIVYTQPPPAATTAACQPATREPQQTAGLNPLDKESSTYQRDLALLCCTDLKSIALLRRCPLRGWGRGRPEDIWVKSSSLSTLPVKSLLISERNGITAYNEPRYHSEVRRELN